MSDNKKRKTPAVNKNDDTYYQYYGELQHQQNMLQDDKRTRKSGVNFFRLFLLFVSHDFLVSKSMPPIYVFCAGTYYDAIMLNISNFKDKVVLDGMYGVYSCFFFLLKHSSIY